MRRKILGILIIIWMILIFISSNQNAEVSSGVSDSVIYTFFENFTTILPMNIVQFIIRKLAHFTIYAIGAILTILYLKTYNINTKKQIICTMIFVCFYAITDEFHQTFIDGRSGEIRDVLIDSFGAIMGVVIIQSICFFKKHMLKYKSMKN